MLRLRRPQPELRIELIPLIDVMMFLLTFFIYTMALMVRADLLPVQMQQFASARPATAGPVAAVTIDQAGELFLNREPVAIDEIVAKLQALKRDQPETVIYLAADERGDTDRLPRFLDLYDRLAFAGLDIKLVGAPKEDIHHGDTEARREREQGPGGEDESME